MIESILNQIQLLLQKKSFVLVAIDGRCGAGKTTLAAELQRRLFCNVMHMDDFFLRPQQRTEQRLQTPGENIDHERFLQEVLLPLSKHEAFSYRPYSCSSQTLAEPACVQPAPVTVIEGSYACHRALWPYYDLHVFLDIDSESQLRRIAERNGEEAARIFRDKWIPLEEAYFEAYSVQERCEIVIKTNAGDW